MFLGWGRVAIFGGMGMPVLSLSSLLDLFGARELWCFCGLGLGLSRVLIFDP